MCIRDRRFTESNRYTAFRGSFSDSSQRLRDADVQRSLRVSRADVGDTKVVNEVMSAALSDSAVPPCVESSVPCMRAYDVSKCMARTTGKKQCQRARVRNSEFCAQHKKTAATGMLPYGRCDTALREDASAPKPRRSSCLGHGGKPVYYCRLTMWQFAAAKGVNDLAELTDEQYAECLEKTHEYFRKHPACLTTWKIDANQGPSSSAERNTDKARYNGNAKACKYYSRQVFIQQLTKLNENKSLQPHEATERQFMKALAETSLQMQRCHCVRASKFQVFEYRGPQCLPHRDDVSRLVFEPQEEVEKRIEASR